MTKLKFPQDFTWGVAAAAFQIEGACDRDGRGESIWDRYCKMPGRILDGSNGDMGCDHYDHYEQDIKLMKELGIRSYRLSIAWPRIFPNGFGEPNQKGIDFYKKLIRCMLDAEIEPVVTLYHWDLPQKLQDIGGWANRQVTDYFEQYARYLFKELGDMVKTWITHNEPYCASFVGNWAGRQAPGLNDFGTAVLVSHHLLLSHGKAVKAFREMGCKGEIGITLNMNYYYPKTDSPDDKIAAELSHSAWNKWFSDPIFKKQYPQEIVAKYNELALMPQITSEDMEIISQPIDFLGLNNYFAQKSTMDSSAYPISVRESFFGNDFTEMGWGINPEGLHDLLVWIKKDYGDVKIIITENGAAFRDLVSSDGKIYDYNRIEYLTQYLAGVHRAIQEGVNLKGYYLWSLMDNFEWAYGYSKRFGIIHVDYNSKVRTIKESGYWYQNLIKENS